MNEPTSLSEVVERAMARHGVTSGRALAERSEAQGIPISYTTLNALRKSAYRRRLDRETRGHLAQLAGVPEEMVDRLAGAPTARFVLPDSADELEGDQREAVLATVRAFVAANRRAQEQGESDEDGQGATIHDLPARGATPSVTGKAARKSSRPRST